MSLFNFSKKEENKDVFSKGTQLSNNTLKVLGSGCKKCNELEKNAIKALKLLEIDADIEHITDFKEIAAYGVMSTPALVFRDKVISYGKVLKTDEIVKLLQKINIVGGKYE